MAAQVTNTVITILDLADARDWPGRFAFGDRIHRGERYVGEGRQSLRATIGAAGAVDAFRLHPLNVNALTFLGVTAPVVQLTPGEHYVFSFMCRCSQENNLVRVRVVCRDATPAVILTLNSADGDWLAGAGGVVTLGTGPRWVRRAVQFVAPATDDAGALVDSCVWQISNGTAAAQLLDIDDIRMHRTDDQAAE